MIVLFLSAAGVVSAQGQCPTVDIVAAGPLKHDTLFTAQVKGAPKGVRPKFLWKISGAEKFGDETSDMLLVSILKTKLGDPITISVDVVGYDPSCRVTKTLTIKNTVAPYVCDTLNINGPTSVTTGELADLKFTATGGSANKSELTYAWSVSAGMIESGQGTPNIKINTSDAEGKSITATVGVQNLGLGCSNIKDFTFSVVTKPTTKPAAKPKQVKPKKVSAKSKKT